jgi:ribose-phosphate pyrophosphokinase
VIENIDGGIIGVDYFGSKDLQNPVIGNSGAGGVFPAKKFKDGLAHKCEMNDIGWS